MRCAAESRAREEPLLATASRVRRWLLVEQPGPWGRDALTQSRLDAGVAASLAASARAHGVRVVLVRRPGWISTSDRRVSLVHVGAAGQWIEHLRFSDERDLTRIDLSVVASPDPPGIGATEPDGVHLVCTNGKHDACCADLGRPVVRALQEAGSEEVWESSHIGGDRFAANIVCLPTGTYYGRVDPDEAARLLADHRRGILDLDRYRGRCAYPPLVQAAEVFLRRSMDERRIDALRLTHVEREDRDRALVSFEHVDGGRFDARVDRRAGPAELLTCTAGEASAPWAYRLLDLRSPSA